jgi:hypothetical protein
MTLPNFLIIGAAKSGTSSLFSYLGQHPQIYTSPIKGPCFFAFEEGEKVKVFGPGDQATFDRHIVTERRVYEDLFDGIKDEKAFGEASVLYLYSPTAAARIKRAIPNAKLIALLRNPVDRAFSSYSHLRRDGRETLDDFGKGLLAEESRVNAHWQHLWHYTRLGFYHEQLTRYYEVFDPSQIAVYTLEEFRDQPLRVLRELFSFLGVDDRFVPDVSTRHNVSGTPKSMSLHRFLTRPNSLKTIVKPWLPSLWRKKLRGEALKWNTVVGNSRLADETRSYLIDLYRDDVLKLQSLIHRDLSHWLKARSTGDAKAAAQTLRQVRVAR